MPHVEYSRHVGWGDHHGIWLSSIGNGDETAIFHPVVIPFRFYLFGVVLARYFHTVRFVPVRMFLLLQCTIRSSAASAREYYRAKVINNEARFPFSVAAGIKSRAALILSISSYSGILGGRIGGGRKSIVEGLFSSLSGLRQNTEKYAPKKFSTMKMSLE